MTGHPGAVSERDDADRIARGRVANRQRNGARRGAADACAPPCARTPCAPRRPWCALPSPRRGAARSACACAPRSSPGARVRRATPCRVARAGAGGARRVRAPSRRLPARARGRAARALARARRGPLRNAELHSRAARLGQADRDRLLGRTSAVLALADVVDLFAHEFARLGAGATCPGAPCGPARASWFSGMVPPHRPRRDALALRARFPALRAEFCGNVVQGTCHGERRAQRAARDSGHRRQHEPAQQRKAAGERHEQVAQRRDPGVVGLKARRQPARGELIPAEVRAARRASSRPARRRGSGAAPARQPAALRRRARGWSPAPAAGSLRARCLRGRPCCVRATAASPRRGSRRTRAPRHRRSARAPARRSGTYASTSAFHAAKSPVRNASTRSARMLQNSDTFGVVPSMPSPVGRRPSSRRVPLTTWKSSRRKSRSGSSATNHSAPQR